MLPRSQATPKFSAYNLKNMEIYREQDFLFNFLRWLYYLPLFHKLLPPSSFPGRMRLLCQMNMAELWKRTTNGRWGVVLCWADTRVLILSSPGCAWGHACDISMYEWGRQYHYDWHFKFTHLWFGAIRGYSRLHRVLTTISFRCKITMCISMLGSVTS